MYLHLKDHSVEKFAILVPLIIVATAHDPTQPATQADVQFLAQLVMKNSTDIEELKNGQESLEDQLTVVEEKMDAGLARVEKAIQGIATYVSHHEDKLQNHEAKIGALEVV